MKILTAVEPTPAQLNILKDARPGYRLIRGAAGSGKTTAAVMRLRQLVSTRLNLRLRTGSDEPVTALVLTFNRTLSGYVSELARRRFTRESGLNIDVMTFAGWAVSKMGNRAIMQSHESDRKIRELLRAAGVKQGDDIKYFQDEIAYILGRFKPTDYEAYLDAIRSGRGRSPAVRRPRRRELIDRIIGPYQEFKAQNEYLDWNDVALQVANRPAQILDILVVDEAQDMSANQIRAMRSQLKEDHATTFIMDAAQRIYPQSFAWREVGLSFSGRDVFVLAENHRNTKEIARFAAGLVRGLNLGQDGVIPDSESCSRSGRKPIVVQGRYRDQIEYMLKEASAKLAKLESIAFIKPRGGSWFRYLRARLRAIGIAYCEISRKNQWPQGDELVALSTIHSVKGLEFDHVMIPGLNQEVTPHGREEGDGTLESLRRLLAMGIGRARKSVTIGYKQDEASSLINYLEPGTFHLIKR